ncbi:glycosyl transferase family 2 [Peptococcaceae bacterium CEB3]|nr:glycosyl transferase family 2 [Peptococcaceae bacterium CEB3]
MFDAVIPAKDEEKSILASMTTVLRLPLAHIILVVNGSTDRTLELANSIPDSRLRILHFREALGLDVPRAVGAVYARRLNSKGVLFVDGDMSGDIFANLDELLTALAKGVDVALTNCYPYITHRAQLVNLVLKIRGRLNRELDFYQTLGLATPTHGPHALSARALAALSPDTLAVPPLILVEAKRAGLQTRVATSIPHEALHSPRKHRRHGRLLAETIMGDCLMAIDTYQNRVPSRRLGRHELAGYHPERRFDLLRTWAEACANADDSFRAHLFPRFP